MNNYHALRQLKVNPLFGQGDVLVLFGELFQRGYANGLVEAAQKRGMKVIYGTVGRRDSEGQLRPLTAEELKEKQQPLINQALEAGFDLEPASNGVSPVQQLKDIKLSAWEEVQLDMNSITESRQQGQKRFRNQVVNYLNELKSQLPKNKNILFAHLMAGGVPRAKIVLPLMNRVVKGTGDRFLDSEKFWNSPIGKFCSQSFEDVTANTFDTLIDLTSDLRQEYQKTGNHIHYVAYGYHGTEVLVENNYQWQSYAPYLQGWAKTKLEDHAKKWSAKSVVCSVYNCPEILTQSSSIFSGVEICLYPLMAAILKEKKDSPKTLALLKQTQSLLKDEFNFDHIFRKCWDHINSPIIKKHYDLATWPQHNSKEQLEKMLNLSDELAAMHKDQKQLLSFPLSEVVFQACGDIMLNDIAKPEAPVSWINHDIIAKHYLA